MLRVSPKSQRDDQKLLQGMRERLHPLVEQLWKDFHLGVWKPASLTEVMRSPNQITREGGRIHYLACGERTACFSQLLQQHAIDHRLCLLLIKRPFQAAKLGASIEIQTAHRPIYFVSATSHDFLTCSSPHSKASTKDILKVLPQGPGLGFYEAFGFSKEASIPPQFSLIDKNKILRSLQTGSNHTSFQRTLQKRRDSRESFLGKDCE